MGGMKHQLRLLMLCVALVGITFPASSLLFGQTVTPATPSYNFGSINVCPSGKASPAPCSATHTVSFNITAGTTIGGIDIVLGGAPGLDFQAKADDTSTTLCTAKTYTEATTCTVDVTFAPLGPGTRNGAVEIIDGNGELLATAYVFGVGVGPQIAFAPAKQVSHALLNDTFAPQEVAVDASGNLFVVAYNINNTADEMTLTELTAKSGYHSMTTITTVDNIDRVVVDGAGNLFFINLVYEKGDAELEVSELYAVGGYTRSKVVINPVINVTSLAIDSAGNLFLTISYPTISVLEYPAAGDYKSVKTIGGTFKSLNGITVDGNENVFVADDGVIKEIVAAGGYATTKILNSSIPNPSDLAINAAGNILVSSSKGVEEIVAASGYSTVNSLIPDSVRGVAVDANGNIYTAIQGSGTVELLRSQPPALQFPPTHVDSTSSDSPMSLMAQNIGNAILTGSGIAFTDADDFTRASGSGTPADCASSFSLAPGAACNLSVDFTPASGGTLSGSLVLTDNAGNATAATQSIALSGNGLSPGGPVAQVSATTLTYGSVAFPSVATQSLTVTNTGGGKLTVGPSTTSLDYKVTSSTCAGGVTTGSCVLQVQFDPTSVGFHPDFLTLATNGPANPRIHLTATATGVGAGYIFDFGSATLSPITSIDFGTIHFPSNSALIQFPVSDIGVPGSVTVKTSIDGPDYQIVQNFCEPVTSTPPYNSCSISVEFLPLSPGGHWEHLTLIPSVGPPSTIELTGIAEGIIP